MAIKAWKLNRPIHLFVPDAREAGTFATGRSSTGSNARTLDTDHPPDHLGSSLATMVNTDITNGTPRRRRPHHPGRLGDPRIKRSPRPGRMNGFWVSVLQVTRTVRWDPTGWTPSAEAGVWTYCTLRTCLQPADDTVPVAPRCSTAASSSARSRSGFGRGGIRAAVDVHRTGRRADSLRAVAERRGGEGCAPGGNQGGERGTGVDPSATTVTCGKWSTGRPGPRTVRGFGGSGGGTSRPARSARSRV